LLGNNTKQRLVGTKRNPNFLAKSADIILCVDPKSIKIMEEKEEFTKPLI
jgi:hypothetical protein